MKNQLPPAPAADDEDAALAALLAFAPVPRRPRVGGWSADVQRGFVAALAATGSPTRAAAAVGRAPFGVDQLFKAAASEGFRAACAAAMDLAHARDGRRVAAGVEGAAAAAWSPPAPGRARDAELDGADREAASAEWLMDFVRRYQLKIAAERAARLDGRIVEADFYLRQATHLEVMIDLAGTDGFAVMSQFREREYAAVDIADTPFSRILAAARRRAWAAAGEPPRPAPTAEDLLVDHGRFRTEPLKAIRGGPPADRDAQQRAYDERHARDAALQIEWEARARRDYEARQRRNAK